MIRTVWKRLYRDYVMPNRMADYEQLLGLARAMGYGGTTIGAFYRDLKNGLVEDGHRALVLRHDIDSSPELCPAFAAAEERAGMRGSYFFRLSTIDVGIMRDLAAAGHEVGYHYEELATIAKERGANRTAQVDALIPAARERFAANLAALRERTRLPLRVAASHGDFANRALGVTNVVILQDRAFRAAQGIDVEAYDADLMRPFGLRVADTYHPAFWKPELPQPALRAGVGPGYILTHPRQWGRQPLCNARDDLLRLVEGALFTLGIPRAGGGAGQRAVPPAACDPT
ncbi:hypothetical protein [Azospirillum rugosum]|uniref:Polysaccharide deacetylase n=1 Tax=Azospirillum rugosum TaxID=416170 RepID=A0ABS4SH59_9PROT|nr:hypothetical protein [Azospirillum rugosum]MBP2291292.1 hypothetical protein [Azospirillum rugosum]MDQ0525080.1 hypothetical protein [Azospirillum rugosum]